MFTAGNSVDIVFVRLMLWLGGWLFFEMVE